MANLLTNKLGPLPTWGWLGIATAGLGGYYLYEKSKGNGPAPATSGQAQTPEYVFQNYNQLPPETPAPRKPPDNDEMLDKEQDVDKKPRKKPGRKPPFAKPVQYQAPKHGRAPTLAELARKYHTTPEAIIKASGGKENPHGQAWKDYVRRRRFNTPIPRGTNLDIPRAKA